MALVLMVLRLVSIVLFLAIELFMPTLCEETYLSSTVMDCGTLSNPENGQVSHTGRTTFKQTATYCCNTGYNLVGNSIRTCLAIGVWSGCAPTCQRMLLLTCMCVCVCSRSSIRFL